MATNAGMGSLAGKKTYIVAAVTIIGVLASYLTGVEVNGQLVLDMGDGIQAIVTAILGATVRHGISTK